MIINSINYNDKYITIIGKDNPEDSNTFNFLIFNFFDDGHCNVDVGCVSVDTASSVSNAPINNNAFLYINQSA